MIRLFDELVAAGKTIVMVTHDREIASHARRTVHMVDGSLLDGTLPDDGAPPPTRALPPARARPPAAAAASAAGPTADPAAAVQAARA